MLYIQSLLGQLRRDTRGASAVEYALIVGLIGAALFTGVGLFGTGLSDAFSGLIAKVHLS